MSANLPPPSGFSSSDLVFSDDFSGSNLNSAYWNTYMTSNSTQGGPWDSNGNGGSGLGGIYDAEYFMPYEVSVNNGLTLNAEQKSIEGANYVNGAVVPQTFPVTAGVVNTYGKVEFNGGYLQISMKQPGGTGSWPGLWLLPASGAGNVGNNFEIDIQEGGFTNGSANPNSTFSYHLHTPVGTFGGVIDTGIDLTAGFHTYAIDWVPGKSITWYLDGKEMAQITSAEAPIPDEPMELIMSNQVATSDASSWRSSMDGSTPQSMQMLVNDVQLYQKAGSGDTIMGSNVSATTTTAPSVAITSASGTVAQASQTISGTVDVADAGSTVKILDGTTQVGTAVVGADGKWSTNVTLAHTGANVLTATDSNVAGTGTSNAVTFNLTTAAPTVAITSAGGTVAQASQTISGTVDVADAGSTVKIFDGTTQVGTAVVGADGKWSTNVTLAHTGANVLTATDANVAGTGTSNAVTFHLTTTAPSVAITSAGGTVAQASQTISGTVDVADAGSTVKILDGTSQVGTAVVGADGKWSTNVTLAHTGANVLTATDANVAGTGTSNAVTFNLTTTAPSVAITSAGGTVAQASQTISGTVDVADAGSTVKILDGTTQVGTAVVGADGKWSTNVTLAHTGANVLTATDSNVAGTGTSNAVTFNLSTVTATTPITTTAPITKLTAINSNSGNQTLSLDDNPYAVNLNGYYNVVTAGAGNDTVTGGGGNNNVTLGDGSDTVTLGGYYNVVTAGNGKNAISAGAGNATIVAGNGANTITLAGWNNSVTLGGGTNVVNGGQGNAIIVAGGGANNISLAGWNNLVTLGAGENIVKGGQGNDTVTLTGGAATLQLGGNNETAILGGGVNATIFDTGSNLRIAVDTSSGTSVVNGFAQDRNGYIELRNGAGGYTSVNSILAALKSDGHGGTLLTLGTTGSIDIAGVTPDQLSGNNFRISSETDASMAPTLTIADPSLNVTGGGGTVALGIKVAASASATDVKVTIAGLPSYETISDGLGHTYSGQSITLSAAEVNSGLTLTSHYTGSQHPIATLSVTASDTIGGSVATSAKQSIVVVDPPASTTNAVALLNQYIASGFQKDQGAAQVTTTMAAAVSHDDSFLSRPGHS